MFLLTLLCPLAVALEAPVVNADLKNFFLVTDPYENLLMPPSTSAQAFVDARAKLLWRPATGVKLVAHHVITAGTTAVSSQLESELSALGISNEDGQSSSPLMTGVGLQSPQLIELSWALEDQSGMTLQGRTDRLYLQTGAGPAEIRVGRQPVSFGNGLAFNPMDLVAPFSFATIDAEYKPGIDAVRIDTYWGMSSELNLVIAYAGDLNYIDFWTPDRLVAVVQGRSTLGVTDVTLFTSMNRGDQVFGVGLNSSIGPIGLFSDFTWTLSELWLEDTQQTELDDHWRGVVGALWRPGERTTLTTEFYGQSLGAAQPEDYLEVLALAPYARGELWLMGQYYAMLSVSQELSPLLNASLSATGNLLDQSVLLSPSLALSLSDNANLSIGGFVGIGERPTDLALERILTVGPQIQSEFGLLPGTLFLQLRNYF